MIIKNQILNRWKTVDAMDHLLYPDDFEITCRICGHTAPKNTYKTKTSQCIFNGGRLERFICPECECIFGPLKMFSLSQDELADEYRQHYSVFNESDTTELGIIAFERLLPSKEKVYLNYGAGCWAESSQKLREQGYVIYDYEPYAPAVEDPWLIRSADELKKQKFDGIFSNDLIEHLRYPIDELKFMVSLLNEDGKMSHATGCYDYRYEYTRFHYFFFVGKSLEQLAKQIAMNVTVTGENTSTNVFFKNGVFSFSAKEE